MPPIPSRRAFGSPWGQSVLLRSCKQSPKTVTEAPHPPLESSRIACEANEVSRGVE